MYLLAIAYKIMQNKHALSSRVTKRQLWNNLILLFYPIYHPALYLLAHMIMQNKLAFSSRVTKKQKQLWNYKYYAFAKKKKLQATTLAKWVILLEMYNVDRFGWLQKQLWKWHLTVKCQWGRCAYPLTE